jgi:predicted porin
MKKSLLALAAFGAFAGAAQAQSSVTVYGLLDMGYLGTSTVQRGSGLNGATANASPSLSQQTSGIAGGGQSTSRLGFRGTEDLGGGMNAFFTVEAALNEGTAGTFNAGNTGTRLAFVGLGKRGLGTVQAGTVYTPIFEEVGMTDPGGQNNNGGNMIHPRNGGFGGTNAALGVATTGITRSGNSTNDSYTVRTTNAAVFKTDRFSGLQGKLMLVSAGNDSNNQTSSATTVNNNRGLGGALNFNGVKNLYVTASWQNIRHDGFASAAFAPGYNGGGIDRGTNSSDTQAYYAASYDFGMLTAYAQYISRKATSELDRSNFVKRTAQQIGVKSQLTSTIGVWASAGQGKFNPNGQGVQEANMNGYQLGGTYNLSKRTNLYGIFGNTSTSNAANGAYSTSPTTVSASAAPYSANQSSYAVGVRHTF